MWGALFIAGLFFTSPALARECPAQNSLLEAATVEKVVDGDTLRLADGRLIRLIGINTPEMARKGSPEEPFANRAKLAVKSLLEDSVSEGVATVRLQYDAERKDRYGRTLAHVYLQDGRNLQANLLSNGLAAQIVVPPNLDHRKCYREAELEGKTSHDSVWDSIFQPIPVENLSRDTKGFRVIRGRVISVDESRKSIWLNFHRRPDEGRREGVAVRIARKDLSYFKQWEPDSLKNKTIIVRGWIYPYKKQSVMQVRHPMAVEIVPEKLGK